MQRTRWVRWAALALIAGLVVALPAFALAADLYGRPSGKDAKKGGKDSKGGASAAAADAAGDKPYGDWKKLTKDTEVMKGFFTLYKKRENLYLELRPDQRVQPRLGHALQLLSWLLAALDLHRS